MADHPTRFLPYDFRQMVTEQNKGSPSETPTTSLRPATPGTPVIDRGFESMIDRKSIINQRIDTPLGRRHDDKDSIVSHELNPPPLPLPGGASSSVDRTGDPPGKSKATDLTTSAIAH